MKIVVLIVLGMLIGDSYAQQVLLQGQSKIQGKGTLMPSGPVIPPPPAGIAATFPNAGWNSGNPSKWPPYGSEGVGFCTLAATAKCAKIAGFRMWDNGLKWGQLETANGTWGSAFTVTMTNLLNSTIPSYPMDALYAFGDTPGWAAQTSGGGITSCANPDTAHACLPPIHIDANQTNCNADGAASPSTVHADCGNGSNDIWQATVYHIVNTFKGKIKYYECWNEQDSGNFWTNSSLFGGHSPQAVNQPQVVRAVRMCSDLKHIVNFVDPAARILSPSFHVGTALTWFDYFNQSTVNDPGCSGSCSAALGGATWPPATVQGSQTYDYPNVHARGTSSTNADPTAFLAAYNNTVTEINLRHLPPFMFNDEWGCNNQGTNIQCPSDDYNAYFLGANLSLQAATWATSVPVLRTWYYLYDANGGGGSIAQQSLKAGQAWDTVSKWWIGSTPTAMCSNSGTIWTCPLKLNGVTPAEIKWNQADTSTTGLTCGTGCPLLSSDGFTTSWTDLTNTPRAISGGQAPIGAKPVLLQ